MLYLVRCAGNRRVLMGTLGFWLIAWQVHSAWLSEISLGPAFSRGAYSAILLLCATAAIYRAMTVKAERSGWLLIGIGMVCWTFGDIYYTAFLWNYTSPPVPSPADVGFLLFAPLALAGFVQLWRARLRWTAVVQRTDGLIAALAVSALSAAIVFETVQKHVVGDTPETLTNLAYPFSDLVLLGITVGALGAMGWRPDRVWLLMSIGVGIFTIADSVFLVQVARDSYQAGGVLDSGWSIGMFLIALAAIERKDPAHSLINVEHGRVIWVPLGFAALGLLLLCVAAFAHLNSLAIILASATLAAVMGRLALTFNENVKLLRRFREESLTDVLTGLGNRRAMLAALESEFPEINDRRPLVIVLMDLDGFKQYNDTFGHPAGDALLNRVARKLGSYFSPYGQVFRLGGDEFCAVFSPVGNELNSIVDGIGEAILEKGEGFTITCSYGAIVMPFDATTPDQAIALADQRMYESKTRAGAGRGDGLVRGGDELSAPTEQEQMVIDAVAVTAKRFGFTAVQVQDVCEATRLRDVGKVAMPVSILDKPGELTEEEAGVIKEYPAVAQRLISAESSSWDVAKIVRASHERWDGTGYPDRLRGEDIPLAARIVAVADAMIAMTSPRAYRAPLDDGRALSELGRNAGGQFDPEVVRVFICAWNEIKTDSSRQTSLSTTVGSL